MGGASAGRPVGLPGECRAQAGWLRNLKVEMESRQIGALVGG